MILQGKVAAITGASRGIGQAGAFAFAREGAKVVIASRNDKDGEDTVREIKRQGGEATFVCTDASLVSDMENLIKTTVRTYGKLDIFWHNAGIFFSGHIDLVKDDEYDTDGTPKGAVFGTKFAIRNAQIGAGHLIHQLYGWTRPNPTIELFPDIRAYQSWFGNADQVSYRPSD
jgi:NAD(P)-dependent dehydrogenase (short-subunit alcohol dehydrogenase family)